MRTVHFNRRALAFALLIGAGILILTVSHVSTSLSQPSTDNQLVARDALARRKVEEVNDDQKRPADSVDHQDVDVAAEKHEDFIDEPRKHPETDDQHKSDVNNAGEQNDQEKSKVRDEKDEKEAVVAEPPQPKPTDLENAYRKEFIKNMTRHAWSNYRKFTWGANELKPLSKSAHYQPIFGGQKMAATIIDGADTLYLMGLREEYDQAQAFIKENFTMANANQVSVFETTIRFLGGFLSLYALTADPMYIEKATEVADALMPAFDTKTGIAKSLVNVPTKTASNYGWVSGAGSILSEFGSLHLEFLYLSELTSNPIYRQKVEKIRDVLDKVTKKDGLYSNYMSETTGEFMGSHVSLGALGDSFYEYLIKSYVQTGHKDDQAYRMYKNTSAAIREKMLFTSTGGLKYIAELKNNIPDHKMSHLSCFCPGMFALEASVEQNLDEKRKIMELAEDLGHTCHESYARASTGIGPEMFYFRGDDEATSKHGENGYILRPEAMEGWFYLWRLTGKEKYRTWMWNAVKSIEQHCRTDNGYVGLKNVYEPAQGKDDVQQSFFIAETLKYAYLTFSDDELPLDKWVFNTEAHAFPTGFDHMQKIPAKET